MSSDENNEFEALVVLQFSSSTPTSTKNWVVQRLVDDHHEDDAGAGFLVRWDKDPQSQVKNKTKNCFSRFVVLRITFY